METELGRSAAQVYQRQEHFLTDKFHSCVKFVKCNVTVWVDQLAAFKTAISSSPSGRVDVVIANAGISGGDPVFLDDGMAGT